MKGASKGRSRPWLLVVVVICCVLGAVVQACGGGDSGGGGGSTKKVDMAAELKKPANITVWAWTPGTDVAVKMFEKAYPNIKVKLQNVGQGPPHYRKVRTVLKSGKGLPDVIQMEFQYIPSFTITKSLLDMTPYLPKDFLSKYPEWIQKQINLNDGIYGVPWDSGPLGLIYRQDLLDKAGVKTPIKTWDDFAAAAIKYHKANPKSYLVNLPGGQTGQWLGMYWQNGARPFSSDPNNVKLDLTDPKIKQVTEYWDKLYNAGAISHDADFNSAWYQGFTTGKYAGWISAAWGPIFLQDYTKNSKGKWRAQELPQWNAGDTVSGNWGGSTLAVLQASKNKAAATEFARWILQEQAAGRDVLVPAVPVPDAQLDAQQPEVGGPEVPVLRRSAGQQGVRPDVERRGQGLGVGSDPRVRQHHGRRHQGQVRRPGEGSHGGLAAVAGRVRQLRQAAGPDGRRPVIIRGGRPPAGPLRPLL